MASERDPRVNPLPYDVVEAVGIQQHVHKIKDAQVYCGRWRADKSEGLYRVSLDTWRECCALYEVKVIQRAEDVDGDPLGLRPLAPASNGSLEDEVRG